MLETTKAVRVQKMRMAAGLGSEMEEVILVSGKVLVRRASVMAATTSSALLDKEAGEFGSLGGRRHSTSSSCLFE